MASFEAVKHLAWRAGFGLSSTETSGEAPDLSALLDRLFRVEETMRELDLQEGDRVQMMMSSAEERRQLNRQNMRQLRAEWLDLLAFPAGSDLREKMALFWHDHFACQTLFPGWAQRQLQTLRTYGLGYFRDLLVAISKDAAMLHYLNNQQNRKDHPNENYARELMELFTIGRGHYTEQDVQEAARAFTGWSSDLRGRFVFRKGQHDFGRKTFMGRTGDWDGTDIIDIILDRPQTAHFLATKIFRYFVHQEVDPVRVQELADVMRSNDYHIGAVMRHLFERDWFYDPALYGTRIKSPVELVVGMMRALEVRPEGHKAINRLLASMGQLAFRPPSVAGWPAGRGWINSATLPIRLNLPFLVLSPPSRLEALLNESPRFVVPERRIDKRYSPHSVASLAERLLCVPCDISKLAQFDLKTTQTRIARIMALPEYQMC